MERGRLVGGRFEIDRRVGSGGMGTVYRAVDRQTGGPVAIKVLASGADPSRFAREAAVLSSLGHPGIVPYVAHGADEAAGPWLAMQWVDGEDLERRLARGPLTCAEAVLLGRRVAEALGEAHAHGVVHRDLKPSNVVLEAGDLARVRIIDFGIALAAGAMGRLTRSGVIVGTPRYMAPEQARGERDLDARVDVFALGSMLFECLTATPAFTGEHAMAVLAKVLFAETPRVGDSAPDVPAALDDLIAAMLTKDPDRRPADGRAVAAALAALEGVTASPRPRPAGPAQLGTDELRHVSVVLLGPPRAGGDPGVVRHVAGGFGGETEPLADGSCVVLLPAVGAATDQAARAASCALALRTVCSVPMSLATGLAARGRAEAAGEAIDRAAAGLPRATAQGPSAIWIDDVTDGLLDERFQRRRVADGAILDARADVDAVRTLCGRPAPFVGREAQLETLLGAVDDCVRGDTARAILLTGPPGVGKSRLRHEWLGRVRARGGPPEIWTALGDAVSAGSAFGLAAQLVRRAAGIVEGEPLEVRRAKLRARAARHVAAVDCERVARFLAEMTGASSAADDGDTLRAARRDPIVMGDHVRRAWEDLVDAETAAHPLLIVLDDVQWGDRPSVGLTESVLRLLSARPLLIVAFARPEIDQVFPELWRDNDAVWRLPLGNLSQRESARLARSVLGEGASDTLVARVVDHAAGNAFYLEELIRSVAEGAGDATEWPATVMAMVHSRLDALPADARQVMRAASVFGDAFWEDGVRHLLGWSGDGARLRGWLDELLRRELVVAAREPRFAGQVELEFRHGLFREGAYSTLTDDDRTLSHRLAADWLRGAGEADAFVLARHLERGGERAAAARAYRDAAAQALEGHDMAGAVERAERGLTLGAEGELRGELLATLAEAHDWRGDLARCESAADEALERLPRGSDAWARALVEVCLGCARRGHLERLEALQAELLDMLGQPPVTAAVVSAAARAANALRQIGRYGPADALLAAAGSAAATLSAEPAVRARVAHAHAYRAMFEGSTVEVVERELEAVTAAREAQELRFACDCGVTLGFALSELGAYAEAEHELREVMVAADRMGLAYTRAVAQQNQGWIVARLGRAEEGRRLLREAADALGRQGDRHMQGGARVYLGVALATTGALDAAESELRVAERLLSDLPPSHAFALAHLGRTLCSAGRVDEARTAVAEAMAILSRLGRLEEGEATVRLVYAEVAAAAGDLETARATLAVARDRLLDRAARMEDPGRRASFLGEVPENARTIELARQWDA